MNLRFLISSMLLFVAYGAMAQQKMIVHLKGGQQVTYDINNVDHVDIQAPSDASEGTPAQDVGGIIGNPIDMGLSVSWADINLGAEYPTDDGIRCSWDDISTLASKWGDGWRLPTEAEWQELYNNCTWRWEVRDGVGGRLVTSPSGKGIFIPATGVSFDGNVQIRGCIGIYWTATTAEQVNGVPSSAVGTYFDSANIYRINYPCTNSFSVRLVK